MSDESATILALGMIAVAASVFYVGEVLRQFNEDYVRIQETDPAKWLAQQQTPDHPVWRS